MGGGRTARKKTGAAKESASCICEQRKQNTIQEDLKGQGFQLKTFWQWSLLYSMLFWGIVKHSCNELPCQNVSDRNSFPMRSGDTGKIWCPFWKFLPKVAAHTGPSYGSETHGSLNSRLQIRKKQSRPALSRASGSVHLPVTVLHGRLSRCNGLARAMTSM